MGHGAEELVRTLHMSAWMKKASLRSLTHCVINTGREPVILINRIDNVVGQWTISTNRLTELRRALSKSGR